MRILDIRVLGDPVLRSETRPVEGITDELRELIDDMFTTMHAAEGIGLAAPQVGRQERVAVVDVEGARHVLVNPVVVARAGSARAEEGCLSIPEVYGEVERPETVTIRARDEHGVEGEIPATGLLARCLQHEIDHLHGKLFIDYLGLFKRRSAMAEWERQKEKYPLGVRKVIPSRAGTDGRSEHATTHSAAETGEI